MFLDQNYRVQIQNPGDFALFADIRWDVFNDWHKMLKYGIYPL